MKTQKLNEEYDLYIQDSHFRKNYQPLLTEEFLDWWFLNIPLPQEARWNQKEYFERMSWMLIGWLGSQKDLSELYEDNEEDNGARETTES